MNAGKYIAKNESLKNLISSSHLIKRAARRFVLGDSLQDISSLLKNWNNEGFGVILYPIEANSEDYVSCLKFLAENKIAGSISLRTPLTNLDLVVDEAERTGLRLEVDMRASKTVDDTLQSYKFIKNKHADSVICLQANLPRTIEDISFLAPLSPIVRLVKGAFSDGQNYSTSKDIDINFLALSKELMDRKIKTYFATHDEKIVREIVDYAKNNGIENNLFGFQMLYGVKQDLQDRLVDEGHEMWKYAVYGRDWVPYCVNRLFEGRKNIKYALEAILKK